MRGIQTYWGFECPLYVWMPPYVWMAPCMFGCPHMPPCMFGHPHMFGCPCMLGCPQCLNGLLYVWMPHMPPCMLGHPPCLYAPYVWMIFGCPITHNTKKACFVSLKGCPYAPIHVDAPCTSTTKKTSFVRLRGVHMPPCHILMPPCMFGCPFMLRCHHMFGCPPYVWLPHLYVWMLSKCMVASKDMRDIQTYGGCPNIQGHLNIWGIQMYGCIWTPAQSDKACFLCVVYVQQASKISSKHMGASRHIQGHPNIGVPKHTGEYPNMGHPDIQEGVQRWGHPNIWGIQTYRGASK